MKIMDIVLYYHHINDVNKEEDEDNEEKDVEKDHENQQEEV